MAGGGSSEAAALVPMEDTIEALIDHLIAPLLPMRGSSQNPPSISQQEEMGKQMQAVVLLYNYYHRRQFPQLEFLGFESFCKSASIAKPALLNYMKFMHNCNGGLADLEKQLSITEKMVMDGCSISAALDASKSAPDMEKWPISKVAVFLINPTKETCLLQFSSVTKGVWSLVEKELGSPGEVVVGGKQLKKHTSAEKKTANGSLDKPCEDELQRLAFSEVEYITGITRTNLRVMERDLAYSLSKERTTARLYIMCYTEAVNKGLTEVPVKDVLNSLRGPLVRGGVTAEVTSVVEHYLLLPYADILSGLTNGKASLHEDQRANKQTPCSEQSVDIPSYRDNNIGNKKFKKNGNYGASKNESSAVIPKVEDCGGHCSMKLDKPPSIKEEATNDNLLQNVHCSEILTSKKSVVDTVTSKKECLPLNSRQQSLDVNDIKRAKTVSDTHSDPVTEEKSCSANKITIDDCNDKVSVLDSIKKRCSVKGLNRELSGKVDQAGLIQDGLGKSYHQLVSAPFDQEEKNDFLHSSLRALQKRRDDLCQKQRILEDEIAQCEMKIQTILTGEKKMLIAESRAEASDEMQIGFSSCSDERRQNQRLKRKTLSEAVLCLRSSCQELDDICLENNWILPRYGVLPSVADGKFQASVAVKGVDFECTADGDSVRSPREARESAAAHMLTKLRSMASQSSD
ncbi:uncharacterized protein LOC109710130 isoform X2 [Ananas comosus]|uniref:Uncharacterized protein LOC109710130 isoform X2 n=1 Tax=Ananas comosus TaxID=4615 RepID=A0A6P5F3Y5_ANACO|nr:uncharacterized protein LOC109710130 isoform X2 [Ananas comosus]